MKFALIAAVLVVAGVGARFFLLSDSNEEEGPTPDEQRQFDLIANDTSEKIELNLKSAAEAKQWIEARVGKVSSSVLGGVHVIQMSGLRLVDDELESLKWFPDAKILRAAHNRFHGSGLVHIAEFKQLESLSIYDTPLQDEGLSHIAGLKTLKQLDLANTELTSKGIEHLVGLTELNRLVLDGTRLDDAVIQSVNHLSKLEELRLKATAISDKGIEQLKLSGLVRLFLADSLVWRHLPISIRAFWCST